MSTAPFDPRAQTDVAQVLTTTARLWATTRTGEHLLDLELSEDSSHTLTDDETWTPRYQLQATIVRPDDVTLLDPRAGVRVCLALGYVYAGGQRDEHMVADLALDKWSPQARDALSIVAYSDEAPLRDWDSLGATATYPVGTPVVEVIRAELVRTLGVAPVTTAPRSQTITEEIVVSTGVNRWDLMASLADQADVWFYCDALRTWHIDLRPDGNAQPVAALTTGPVGIVTELEDGVDRREWGNAVLVEYQDRRYGVSSRSFGPLGTDAVGVKAVTVRRAAPYPGATAANYAAGSILRRVITRGASLTITALATYWLRAGDVITDPDGARLIAQRVQFVFPTALMTITTRAPEVS